MQAKQLMEQFALIADAPQGIQRLREMILQLAVRGKLVPQDPSDEPAAVLLAKISAEKERLIKQGTIKRQKPLPPIREEEIPFELPQGWEWVRAGEIFDVQGGIQKTPKRKPVKNYFPYLRVANVQRGVLNLNEIEYFELLDGELEKYRLMKNDILIVEGNGSAEEIGRCALWVDSIVDCVHQNHLIRIRAVTEFNNLFFVKFLNSPSGILEMKRLSVTTSGLYNLSVGKIRNLCIPLPSINESRRITEKVDALMALCDEWEARLQAARHTQEQFALAAVALS